MAPHGLRILPSSRCDTLALHLYQLSIFDYKLTMEMVSDGRRARAHYPWLILLMYVGLLLNAFKFACCCWLAREFLHLFIQWRTIG